MKSIATLISDIQARLTSGEPFDEETVQSFAVNLTRKLTNRLTEEHKPSLRLSNLGTKCERKLWYSINKPELAEPLSASARFKFLFGDIIEEVVLFLARAAGHSVTHEQEEVNLHGVKGHIDSIIDGHLVDVKSASTYGYRKFKDHGLHADDPFGYLTQLGSYATSLGRSDASFLAVDKTLGHLVLDTYSFEPVDWETVIHNKRDMLSQSLPPNRGFSDVLEGKSGNRKLDLACSYCAFKTACWPGLRVFYYARGPVYLTKVMREPDVPELNHGEDN